MSVELLEPDTMKVAMYIPDNFMKRARKPGMSELSFRAIYSMNSTQTTITHYESYNTIRDVRHAINLGMFDTTVETTPIKTLYKVEMPNGESITLDEYFARARLRLGSESGNNTNE